MMRLHFLILALIAVLLCSCQHNEPRRSVVIYVSPDQVYSEPILKEFESKTGIKVLAVYDVEATKTSGLVNRLIVEKERPCADVYWNCEFMQTLLLKERGVLASYNSPSAKNIPAQYKDPDGYWTGFGGRARVILINTNLVQPSRYPKSIFDLLNSSYPADKIGMSNPLFGTMLSHAAALYAYLGPQKAKEFFEKLQSRGIRVVDGNSVVRDLVVAGQLMMGLTDTDDSYVALKDGAAVKVVFPDQDNMGTLIIPNTVALIAGAPHPQEAKALIDFLLSQQVEEKVIEQGYCQMAVRPTDVKPQYLPISNIKGMNVDFADVLRQLPRVQEELKNIFLR